MTTLFIDTHSNKICYYLKTDKELFMNDVLINKSTSEEAIPLLEKFLNDIKITLSDIDEIIVVNGPGSFTGVRIGVTIAKTISYSCSMPIKTITSLEACGVSSKEVFDIIAIKDPKGCYYAIKSGRNYLQMDYKQKSEFEKYIADNHLNVSFNDSLDLNKILEFLKDKEYTNCHDVNPVYIKKIDVLK